MLKKNAILHCAKNGVSSKDCSIYTPWIPCSRCAKSIIQAGIIEVIYDENFPGNDVNKQNEIWKQSIEISSEILLEANVKIRKFSGKLIKIKGLYQEKEFGLIS